MFRSGLLFRLQVEHASNWQNVVVSDKMKYSSVPETAVCVKMSQSCTELCKCKGKCRHSQTLKNSEDDECNKTKIGVEDEESASGSESEKEEKKLFEIDVSNVDVDAGIYILFDEDF